MVYPSKVAVSSAIPEFVTHNEDGFLAQEENYVEMAGYVIHLYNNIILKIYQGLK